MRCITPVILYQTSAKQHNLASGQMQNTIFIFLKKQQKPNSQRREKRTDCNINKNHSYFIIRVNKIAKKLWAAINNQVNSFDYGRLFSSAANYYSLNFYQLSLPSWLQLFLTVHWNIVILDSTTNKFFIEEIKKQTRRF